MPAFEHSANPNPNASIANAVTIRFVPMVDIPLVVSAIELRDNCEVAENLRNRSSKKRRCTRLRLLQRGKAALRLRLLLVEKRQVGVVPSVFHLFDGNEMEGGRVNHVTLTGGRFRVGKNMAKAGITALGAHLGPLHLV